MEPPDLHRETGDEEHEEIDPQHDQHGGAAERVRGIFNRPTHEDRERRDRYEYQHLEQHKHPVFLAPRTPRKLGVPLERHDHPFHYLIPFVLLQRGQIITFTRPAQ
jgi:hypothetical protein